jgi:hypothetical protein
MPVQTVAATPSGVKLFLKVVFMKQGRRFGLSAEQKLEVWRRWKAGQTLHEIGRAFGCVFDEVIKDKKTRAATSDRAAATDKPPHCPATTCSRETLG